MDNPLNQYFRQPKLYISLPSKGSYNTPGTITGDVANLPIYGMTGMDEIIVKTPDALLTGDSTVSVLQSCCPSITDAWELSMLDADMLFAAIKIATYGNKLGVTHNCASCGEENEYDIDLTSVIGHFNQCTFNNKIVIGDLTVRLKPLTYREYTEFHVDNFKLQQQLAYARTIEEPNEQQVLIDQLWKDMAAAQYKIFVSSIDHVETPTIKVTERKFIIEWLSNCDKEVSDAVKKQIAVNRETWTIPKYPVKCNECGAENSIMIDLDQSSFFGKA
jgi:hypothetical protein